MKIDILDFISKLVSYKTVSADAQYADELVKCSEFLKLTLNNLGFDGQCVKTDMHPIVFAKRKALNNDAKIRIVCYGHYDVQPIDPIEKWKTPPFETVVKDGKIWGRGTADNKGPFTCLLAGLLQFLDKNPNAPIDLAIILEGEEEIGSPSMEKFLKDNKQELSQYDLLLLSDTSAASIDDPTVTIGLRGTGSFDVIFKGPNTDIHSGMFGGIIYNPIQAMTEVCASLHNKDGFVNIPNFYDNIEELADWEREEIKKNPYNEDAIKKHLKVNALYEQKGYQPTQAGRVLPTVEFTGIGGGYQGEGSKSVIPSECFCKISCRTVAGQDTDDVINTIQQVIKDRTPKGIEVSFINYEASGNAYFLNPKVFENSPKGELLKIAFNAVEESAKVAFKNPPTYQREGASIPLISSVKEITNLDAIMFGLFTPEDNLHAPNEGFSLKMIDNALKYYEQFFNKIVY